MHGEAESPAPLLCTNSECLLLHYKQQICIHAMIHLMSLKSCSSKIPEMLIACHHRAKTSPTQIQSYGGTSAAWGTCGAYGRWVGQSQGPFLRSSREEESGEKAQRAWPVGRCVDNNEQLRSTPLLNLNILHVADRRQLAQSPEGCGFGGPMHKCFFSPTVSCLYKSVTDANDQMQTKSTNETEDCLQTSQVITVFFSFTSK